MQHSLSDHPSTLAATLTHSLPYEHYALRVEKLRQKSAVTQFEWALPGSASAASPPRRSERRRSCEKIPEGLPLVAGGGAAFATPPVGNDPSRTPAGVAAPFQRAGAPAGAPILPLVLRWFRKTRSTTGYKRQSLRDFFTAPEPFRTTGRQSRTPNPN